MACLHSPLAQWFVWGWFGAVARQAAQREPAGSLVVVRSPSLVGLSENNFRSDDLTRPDLSTLRVQPIRLPSLGYTFVRTLRIILDRNAQIKVPVDEREVWLALLEFLWK